jgi:hypothetical protein
MIHFVKGSVAWKLVEVISVCGEYPYRSLCILGNERELRKRVKQMSEPQKYRFENADRDVECCAFTLSGKGKMKNIRLRKEALPLLREIGTEEQYLRRFPPGSFRGDYSHIDRTHRNAEIIAMFYMAGVTVAEGNETLLAGAGQSFFMLAKGVKADGTDSINKTGFTRLSGVFYCGDVKYPVYNTRDRAMRWDGGGEQKVCEQLHADAHYGFGGAIVFCRDLHTGFKVFRQEYIKNSTLRLSGIYGICQFFTFDRTGIASLRMFALPDWYRRMQAKVFGNSSGAGWEFGHGTEFYDVFDGETYWQLFADGDFRRLQELKDRSKYDKAAVVGVGSHTDFLQELLLDSGIQIYHIPEDQFENLVNVLSQN